MSKFAIWSAISLMLVGCATIMAPGPDKIAVNSTPEQAKVYLDGEPVGRTPMILPINRKSEGLVRVELEGYEPVNIDRDKVINGWDFGNILFGGVIGITVDLITHNQGKYTEDPIFIELKPVETQAKNASDKKTRIQMKRKEITSQ
jgi:hypothetical protein